MIKTQFFVSIQQKISENVAADKAEKYRLWHHHRHNQLTTIKNIKTITSQAHEQNESVAFKDKSRKEIHQNPSRIYFALVRKKAKKIIDERTLETVKWLTISKRKNTLLDYFVNIE